MRTLFSTLLIASVMVVSASFAETTNRVRLASVETVHTSLSDAMVLQPEIKVPPSLMQDISALVAMDRIPPSLGKELTALVESDKMKASVVQDMIALVSANKLPIATIQEMVALVSANRVPSALVQELVALLEADRIPSAFAQAVISYLAGEGNSMSYLVGLAALAEIHKVDVSNFKAIAAALVADKTSLFANLQPDMFSTLWVLKMQGLDAERKGEDTTEIWKKYWEVFLRLVKDAKRH